MLSFDAKKLLAIRARARALARRDRDRDDAMQQPPSGAAMTMMVLKFSDIFAPGRKSELRLESDARIGIRTGGAVNGFLQHWRRGGGIAIL